jgi:hypothetical protein
MNYDSPNVALVTQTLVDNAGRALEQPGSLDLTSFLDLCQLMEAAVLLDRVEAIESSTKPRSSAIFERLREEEIYQDLRPKLSRDDLRRALSRLPPELGKRVLFDEPNQTTEAASLSDVAPEAGTGSAPHVVTETGALRELDYGQGLDNLMLQIDRLVTYASLHNDVQERAYRGNGYMVVAAAQGLDYFPDFDRVPVVAGTLKKAYQSLPVALYERIAEATGEKLGDGGVVSEWQGVITLPIPPISALVLSRANTLADISDQLMRTRGEFARYREHFSAFKQHLMQEGSVPGRRKLVSRYRALLEEASGANPQIISVTEMLNVAEAAVKVAAAPHLATSYSAGLLAQPIEWLRRWWLRRPLAVLFRLDGKLPRVAEYRTFITKLWGDQVNERLLDESAAHAFKLRQLMASAEDS